MVTIVDADKCVVNVLSLGCALQSTGCVPVF